MNDVTSGLMADLAKGPVSIRSQGFFAFAFRFVGLLGLTCVLGLAAVSSSHSVGLRAIYMFSATAGVFVLLPSSLAIRFCAKGLPELTLTSEGFIYHRVSPTLVRWTDVIACFVTDVGATSSAKTLSGHSDAWHYRAPRNVSSYAFDVSSPKQIYDCRY
ncbi:hypothetical protein [Bradyrhizobium sp. DOA1]|uniref:hypothetical protein n=1 Tax=Bradyrhizobium sp. DOA1 TaxID=1126616 RepID=UPI0012E74061|nr:hypothetical protein [Bradyrhizobium sp. DOA1]